jgi:plasmid stability protein
VKNVTIALDDEIHRKARIRAAELGTSLSALVKQYLETLTDADQIPFEGVREMQTSFTAIPAEFGATSPKDGPPWLVDGKWVYTKDGKPRKPGAMRHLGGGWTDDFDTWPDGFIDALYGDDTPAANTWWLNANDALKKPKGQ